MPRVRLLVRMNIAGEVRDRGSVVDVDGDVASYLAAAHRVEIVRGERPDSPERDDHIERAVTRKRPRPTRST